MNFKQKFINFLGIAILGFVLAQVLLISTV
jgi:hypothetical protein